MMSSAVSPLPRSAPGMSPNSPNNQQQSQYQGLPDRTRPIVSSNPVLQSSVESLTLIRAEIRWIGFIDLVHNLFAFFFLFYYLILVLLIVGILPSGGAVSVSSSSGITFGIAGLIVVIVVILVGMTFLVIGVWAAAKIRGATNEKTTTAAMDGLQMYFILNGFLVIYGFCCNIAMFVIYPFPVSPWGMYLLFSSCLKVVCVCAVRNYHAQLGVNMYNNMLSGPRAPPRLATPIQQAEISNSTV